MFFNVIFAIIISSFNSKRKMGRARFSPTPLK
jgi:hypothetical protein